MTRSARGDGIVVGARANASSALIAGTRTLVHPRSCTHAMERLCEQSNKPRKYLASSPQCWPGPCSPAATKRQPEACRAAAVRRLSSTPSIPSSTAIQVRATAGVVGTMATTSSASIAKRPEHARRNMSAGRSRAKRHRRNSRTDQYAGYKYSRFQSRHQSGRTPVPSTPTAARQVAKEYWRLAQEVTALAVALERAHRVQLED